MLIVDLYSVVSSLSQRGLAWSVEVALSSTAQAHSRIYQFLKTLQFMVRFNLFFSKLESTFTAAYLVVVIGTTAQMKDKKWELCQGGLTFLATMEELSLQHSWISSPHSLDSRNIHAVFVLWTTNVESLTFIVNCSLKDIFTG